MKKKKVTAAELMARLNADPDWIAKREAEEDVRQKRAAELRQAEEPLLEALMRVGWNVRSVWDFVNTTISYPEAIPVLLEHLQRPYPEPILEGIGRALAVPEAGIGWKTILDAYRRDPSNVSTGGKGGTAIALSVTADESVLSDLIDICRDTTNGTSRIFFVKALRRIGGARALKALTDLRDDPDLRQEIARAMSPRRRRAHSQ